MLTHSFTNSSFDTDADEYDDFRPEVKGSAYKVTIISKASYLRQQVEQFIFDSYKKHFSAEVQSYSSIILAVQRKSDHSIVAAIGLSYADENKLFSEYSLNAAVDKEIFHLEKKPIQRSKIIELDSFVVTDYVHIIKVLPSISSFIKSLDVNWVIYTLTRTMKKYFDRMGISLTFLGFAHKEHIADGHKWGKYYSFKPAVYYSSIKNH